MRSFVTSALLVSGSVAAASASLAPRWDWPEGMPLQARQDPGTPRYQCHEDCGTTITLGRVEGYCTNADWRSRYDACMICANTEGIWQYYSNAITPSAAACGLTAVPSPSGWVPTPTSTAAPVEPSTEAPVEQPTSTEAPVDPISSAPAPVDPASTAAVTSAEPPIVVSSTDAPVEQPTSSEEPIVSASSAVVPPESSAAEVPASSIASSAAAEETSSAVEEPVSSGASHPEETSSCSDDATVYPTTAAAATSEPCETDSAGVPTAGQHKPTTLVTKTTEGPAPPAQTPVTGSPSHVNQETEVATAPVVVQSADATDGSVPVPSVVEVSGAGKVFGSVVAVGVAVAVTIAAC
ncbi:hypothetical protein ACHAQH_000752 [Verticillium albo-atrum]